MSSEGDTESKIITTLRAYLELARKSANRNCLVQDQTCVQFLAYILEVNDCAVLHLALQVLELLVDNPEHRFAISRVFGVIEALDSLIQRNGLSEEVIVTAQRVLLAITKTATTFRDKFEFRDSIASGNDNSRNSRHPRRMKTVVLYIQGLDTKDDQRNCESKFVRVKGVVSLTFNLPKKRFILRTLMDLDPEVLLSAVALTGTMTARLQDMACACEGAVQKLPTPNTSTGSGEENLTLPSYLSEEENTMQPASVRATAVTNLGGTLRRVTEGWISNCTQFFSKSFYW